MECSGPRTRKSWSLLTSYLTDGSPSSPAFLKSSAAEFMQYRKCVGPGPSSNTCPRCAPHFLHITSVRFMPNVLSVSVSTFSSAIGAQKLGQPVPDSNFVSELNSALAQHTQR